MDTFVQRGGALRHRDRAGLDLRVQRRLKIGYNRAARMAEEMERQSMVGSLQANGFREVLMRPPPAD